MTYRIIALLLTLLSSFSLFSQIEGDNLFENDQIVKIELNFSQAGFYDSLTVNYETSTYMKADLVLTDETGTYSFEDVGVRLKGNSSYGHPGTKKSFKIDFNKYVSAQNYDGLKKLNFSNAFKDPTLMREKIFFDMCRENGVPAPRANFANVYFNGTLWGFYTLVEQIDDQFLDWAILDDDGNLFKAGANFGNGPNGGDNAADLKYYGPDQANYEEKYVLKSNEDENDWSDLITFTDFVDNSTSADFTAGVDARLEVDQYLRSVAIDNLFSNLDSYTGSARNYYIYHNLTTDKWQWIKWDANEAFGSFRANGVNDLTRLPINYSNADRPLLEQVFNSPELYSAYQEALCTIVNNYFNPDYLLPRIDAIKLLIQESVYADDNKMYTDNEFNTNIETNLGGGGGGPGGGGTTYGLKSFVQSKYDFINTQLDCASIISNENIVIAGLNIYPNPVSNMLNIRWESDDVAKIELYTTLGIKVMDIKTEQVKNISLDLSQLNTGMYYISLQTQGASSGSYTQSIIKI